MGEDERREIFQKIVEIQVRQEERHVENKRDFKVVFEKLQKLENLPCATHIEKMKGYDSHIKEYPIRQRWAIGLYISLLVTIVGALMHFSYNWGQLEQKVSNHLRSSNGRLLSNKQ